MPWASRSSPPASSWARRTSTRTSPVNPSTTGVCGRDRPQTPAPPRGGDVNATRPAPMGMSPVTWLRPAVDIAAAANAARNLLHALGADLSAESLADTPRRMARMYAEMLTPEPFDLTTFPNDEGYDELVIARNIPFHSLCEHHLLPFHGVSHVAYLPGQRILGLSKLARVVDLFAAGLQVQERLTRQASSSLHEPARRLQTRRHHRHLRPARPDSHRPAHTRRVPGSRTSRAMTLTPPCSRPQVPDSWRW